MKLPNLNGFSQPRIDKARQQQLTGFYSTTPPDFLPFENQTTQTVLVLSASRAILKA